MIIQCSDKYIPYLKNYLSDRDHHKLVLTRRVNVNRRTEEGDLKEDELENKEMKRRRKRQGM